MPFGADSSGPMDACGRHLANTIKQSKLAAMRAVVTITINFIFLVHFTVAVSVAKVFFSVIVWLLWLSVFSWHMV